MINVNSILILQLLFGVLSISQVGAIIYLLTTSNKKV